MIKKTVLILLFVFIAAIGQAEIHGFFEAGKAIENELAKAEIEIQWWIGQNNWKNELYGGWETWFLFRNWEGMPFRGEYTIGDRIHFKDIYLELEHRCNHPIYSYYNTGMKNETRWDIDSLTTVSIGVKW